MKFTVLTLFPAWFDGPFGESVLARASAQGLLDLNAVNIREFATDKHQTMDDAPYGGGGGMLFKAEPVARALDAIAGAQGSAGRAHVIYTSPRGTTWDQSAAHHHAARGGHLVILCGRYEGLDQRIIDSRVDEEVSLGDFVMTGGEIAAMAIVDSIARLIPGVLGNEASAANDSFSDGLLEAPHYTRPDIFEGLAVPDVLLSGHHGRVREWRLAQSIEVTKQRRPELYEAWKARQPDTTPKRRRRRVKTDQGSNDTSV